MWLPTLSFSLPLHFEKCLGTPVHPSRVSPVDFSRRWVTRMYQGRKEDTELAPWRTDQGDKLDYQDLQDWELLLICLT